MGDRIREARLVRGWSQEELARRAGISRQQMSAIERGTNTPGVTAALTLARALDTTVEALFAAPPDRAEDLDGAAADGPVRAAMVGDHLVAVASTDLADEGERWPMVDGTAHGGTIDWLDERRSDLIVAGCDPILGLLARLVEAEAGQRLVAVHRSTGLAMRALAAERVHAALVHGPVGALTDPPRPVERVHLARWQVGLASVTPRSLESIANGGTPVVQRDAEATTQAALHRAVRAGGRADPLPGPVGRGHLDVARRVRGCGPNDPGTAPVGITMEPAARAFGLAFTPIETHIAELWIDARWVDLPAVTAMIDTMTSRSLARQVGAFVGYDLAGSGSTVS